MAEGSEPLHDRKANEPLTQGNIKVPKLYCDSRGEVWREAFSEDGIYYYNVKTRQTIWDPPGDFTEVAPWQAPIPPSFSFRNRASATLGVTSDYGYGFEIQSDDQFHDSNAKILESIPVPFTDWVVNKLEDGREYYTNAKLSKAAWNLPDEIKKARAIKKSEKIDKKRPITAQPIAGTTWYVVLTGEGRIFYYDHITCVSFWSRPDELENNSSLEKILEKLEPQRRMILSNLSGSNSSSLKETLRHKLALNTQYNTDENSQDEPPLKLFKQEDSAGLSSDENLDIVSEKAKNVEKISDQPLITSFNEELVHGQSLVERTAAFLKLLEEKHVSAFATYESEVLKLEKDERFKLLPNKERKQLFNQYLQQRVEKEKDERHAELQKKHQEFDEFLRSVVKSNKTTYNDILLKYSSDPRFRVIPKEKERESLFTQFMQNFKTVEPVHQTDNSKNLFFEMLDEIKDIDAHTPWRRVKKRLIDDPRFIAVPEAQRAIYYDQFLETKVLCDKAEAQERAKFEREKASLRERERNFEIEKRRIQEASSSKRKELEKDNAKNEFRCLLNDHINDPRLSWSEAKDFLRNDQRWRTTKILSRDECFKIFDDHLDNLNRKLTDNFRKLLDEAGFSLTSSWEKLYNKIRDDSRCKHFSSRERVCKNEFYKYLEEKISFAKNELRALLSETKMIDYRFLAKAKLFPNLYDELFDMLQKDSRFTVLDHLESERRKIIENYLLEMEKKGPPPPPTAPGSYKL